MRLKQFLVHVFALLVSSSIVSEASGNDELPLALSESTNSCQKDYKSTAGSNSVIHLSGRVIKVLDGDTVDVIAANLSSDTPTLYKIRLDQIDAPEKSQAFGRRAKYFLSNLIFGKNVEVQISKLDRYCRFIGTVFYDNQNINLKMVESGYAWAYEKYITDQKYKEAENKAKLKGVGLWIDPQATPPWEWRHNKYDSN